MSNLDNAFIVTASSKEELRTKVAEFLEGYSNVPLVLTADDKSYRFKLSNITCRAWNKNGKTVYETCFIPIED